jgi:retron-type reverse transcriptase
MVKQEEIDIVAGVPQGGPISPTIANMVLDGLERHVKAAAAHLYDAKA